MTDKIDTYILKILSELLNHDCHGTQNAKLDVKKLESLTQNRNYLISNQNKTLVLKILDESRSIVDRKNEIGAQIKTSNIKLSPKTIFPAKTDNTLSKFMLTSYVPHQKLILSDLEDIRTLKKIVTTISMLHKSQIKFNLTSSPIKRAQNYLSDAILNGFTEQKIIKALTSGIKQMQKTCFSYKNISPCHCDLHIDNFIITGSNLLFIDWECATNSDPMFDLALLCFYSNFDRNKMVETLKFYFDTKNPSQKKIKIVENYRLLCLLMMSSWLCLQLALQNRKKTPLNVQTNKKIKLSKLIPTYITRDFEPTDPNFAVENLLLAGIREFYCGQ